MEPLRMLPHPRVIGTALQGVVQGDLHAVGRGRRPPGRRSPRACRAGAMAVCPPSARRSPTGSPGRPVPRQGVVPALALGRPDGMDRRQVHDVEPHGRHRRRRLSRPARPPWSGGTARTRRPTPGPLPVDPQRPRPAPPRRGRRRPAVRAAARRGSPAGTRTMLGQRAQRRGPGRAAGAGRARRLETAGSAATVTSVAGRRSSSPSRSRAPRRSPARCPGRRRPAREVSAHVPGGSVHPSTTSSWPMRYQPGRTSPPTRRGRSAVTHGPGRPGRPTP